MMDAIRLHILSPEGKVLDTMAELVTLPGEKGRFTVLKDHAALVTALEKGDVRYVHDGQEKLVPIKEGFAEVRDNTVTVCAEI